MIECRDVVKTYDTGTTNIQALRGMNFAVNRGEMVSRHGTIRLRQDDPA